MMSQYLQQEKLERSKPNGWHGRIKGWIYVTGISNVTRYNTVKNNKMNVQGQDVVERSTAGWSCWRARYPLWIERHSKKYRYKGVNRKISNLTRYIVQRKRGQADEILLSKVERFFRSIIYRDWKKNVVSLLLFLLTKKHIPGLSKSMQIWSLASYHSEETAAAREPPKALLFFLGVTGVETPKTSKIREKMG